MRVVVLHALLKIATDQLLPDATEQEINKRSVVVCSPDPSNSVIAMSQAFEMHTGFAASAVIGKNLRFLQGEKTDQSAINMMRYLIQNQKSGSVDILNYHQSGTPFFHRVELQPVFDYTGALQCFVALQTPIEL